MATQTITGVPGRDGPAYYDVDTRINSDEEANIDGWEMAWQTPLATLDWALSSI